MTISPAFLQHLFLVKISTGLGSREGRTLATDVEGEVRRMAQETQE